jgi:hypothetical protein
LVFTVVRRGNTRRACCVHPNVEATAESVSCLTDVVKKTSVLYATLAEAGCSTLETGGGLVRPGRLQFTIIFGPQIKQEDPLNLSILISGGKETNKDSPSNGE